jgi:hypothetical protein
LQTFRRLACNRAAKTLEAGVLQDLARAFKQRRLAGAGFALNRGDSARARTDVQQRLALLVFELKLPARSSLTLLAARAGGRLYPRPLG